MEKNTGFQNFKDIFDATKRIKPPAHQWQELALRIIDELHVPAMKRNSVFKVCKQYPRAVIEKCLTDTTELCQTGDKHLYFFKVVENYAANKKPADPAGEKIGKRLG